MKINLNWTSLIFDPNIIECIYIRKYLITSIWSKDKEILNLVENQINVKNCFSMSYAEAWICMNGLN